MSIVNNIKASYDELIHKVSWPTQKELSNSTVVVLIASLIMSAVLFAIDFAFESVMKTIYTHVHF
ncbi:MAG: preprotein translocase subunit SecE [Candidatus Symbiothrix sp.]|jgi:preprotein translocase subunit SecE|nr:preprotein translocase subunit SecE [Candidatus Symbiothrix sp.]